MTYFYTTIFLIWVIYTIVTFILGNLLNFTDLDGDIDIDVDFDLDVPANVDFLSTLFPISPFRTITIVSFITVFWGVGLICSELNWLPIIVFIIAITTSLIVSMLLFRLIVVPLYRAQSTSSVTQDKFIGLKAKVISTILENGYGSISYEINGNKYNSPAKHIKIKKIIQK